MRRLILAISLWFTFEFANETANAEAESVSDCSESQVIRGRDKFAHVVCRARRTETRPGLSRPLARRVRQAVPDVLRFPALRNVAPVGECRSRGTSTITREELNRPENRLLRDWFDIVNRLPRCPSVEIPPEEVAVDVLERFPLPAPRPFIAPGRAIAGKLAYLEPNLAAPLVSGKPTVTNTLPTALGDLTMTATAVYYVDWGDVETGPHPGPGGPWPKGNITHSWSIADVYDIEVTAVWTVRWRLGSEQGTLTVPTEGTIEDFRVNQLQAVRNR